MCQLEFPPQKSHISSFPTPLFPRTPMAKMASQQNLLLSPSTSLLPPSAHNQNLRHTLKSSSLPTRPMCTLRSPNSRKSSFISKASSTAAAAVVPDNIADVLGEVSIFTAIGEPAKFKDLWDQKEGMAVVALLRHFGCPCCWELALTLNESMESFESAGVKLIAVGVGSPEKARLLAERLPFPLDCLYADPERKAYDILGLYYGFRRTFFNPASAKVFSRGEALRKATKNYTIQATPDERSSVLQQGGMFVFKGKQLLYARRDEGTGDHAPLDDILDVCCKVPAA